MEAAGGADIDALENERFLQAIEAQKTARGHGMSIWITMKQ